jgi:MFS family permease
MSQIIEDKKIFANAVTWSSTIWQFASVSGPAMAGMLYAWLGMTNTYIIQTILMVIAIFACMAIAPKSVPVFQGSNDIGKRLAEGIKFVFNNQLIISSISLDLFAVLFGGAVALLPIFASDILFIGAEGLGWLRSAPALGSVLVMVFTAYLPIKRHAGKILLTCVAGFGVCMIGFALSSNAYLSFLWLLMSGAFDSVSVVIRSTLLQLETPEHMKGRVSAVNSIFINSSNEIGAFESGAVAEIMGVIPSVIFGGCMTLLVVLVTSIKAVRLRNLDLK